MKEWGEGEVFCLKALPHLKREQNSLSQPRRISFSLICNHLFHLQVPLLRVGGEEVRRQGMGQTQIRKGPGTVELACDDQQR